MLIIEPSPIFSHFEKPCVNVGFECKGYSSKTNDFVISAIRNAGNNAIVLDSAVSLGWALPDEFNPILDPLLEGLTTEMVKDKGGLYSSNMSHRQMPSKTWLR